MQNATNNTPRQRSRTPCRRGFTKDREWSVLNYNVLNTVSKEVYPPKQSKIRPKDLVLAHVDQKEAEAKNKAVLKAEKQKIARERTRQSKERYRTLKAHVASEKAADAEAVQEEHEEQRGRPIARAIQRANATGSFKSRSPKGSASNTGTRNLSKAFREVIAKVDEVAAFYGDLSEVSDDCLALFEMDLK